MALCSRLPSVCLPACTHTFSISSLSVCVQCVLKVQTTGAWDLWSGPRWEVLLKCLVFWQLKWRIQKEWESAWHGVHVYHGCLRWNQTKRCVWVISLFRAVELQFCRITRHNPYRVLLPKHMTPDHHEIMNQSNQLFKLDRRAHLNQAPASAGRWLHSGWSYTQTATHHTRVNLARCSVWCCCATPVALLLC